MNYFIQKAKAFVRDEDGATAIEYGLIAALISVVIIAAVTNIGNSLNGTFESVANALGEAPAAGGGGAPAPAPAE
jgi:pilus assembly protein Flp/PilA